jgi:hypothetical protein
MSRDVSRTGNRTSLIETKEGASGIVFALGHSVSRNTMPMLAISPNAGHLVAARQAGSTDVLGRLPSLPIVRGIVARIATSLRSTRSLLDAKSGLHNTLFYWRGAKLPNVGCQSWVRSAPNVHSASRGIFNPPARAPARKYIETALCKDH